MTMCVGRVCVCACVFVCVRERGRERERKKERKTGRQREFREHVHHLRLERVYVYVCEGVCKSQRERGKRRANLEGMRIMWSVTGSQFCVNMGISNKHSFQHKNSHCVHKL